MLEFEDKHVHTTVKIARQILRGTVVGHPDANIRREALMIASAAAAMCGTSVHIVCHSDVIARQSHQAAENMLGTLGIRCVHITENSDHDTRAEGYKQPIVFASATRLAQDFLRDQVGLSGRGSGFRGCVARLGSRSGSLTTFLPEYRTAFVQDADLVMIGASHTVRFADFTQEDIGRVTADQAFAIISTLERDIHYSIDPETCRVMLTDAGAKRVETFALLFSGPWADKNWRERTIFAALTIRDLFEPDVDYSVVQGSVLLNRFKQPAKESPSISELVAAKESLPGRRGVPYYGDTTKLLRSYSLVGGIGTCLSELRSDFQDNYGIKLFVYSRSRPNKTPTLFSDEKSLLFAIKSDRAHQSELTAWIPTAEDVDKVIATIELKNIIVGDQIFACELELFDIVQIGAAPIGWENRLTSLFANVNIHAYASPDDGLFAVLGKDHPDIAAWRKHPTPARYRAAQAARAEATKVQRQANNKSEAYFERILGFVGDQR